VVDHVGLGRNSRRRTTMTLGDARAKLPAPLLGHYLGLTPLPPGADDSWLLVIDKAVRSGSLAESALRFGGTNVFARFERTLKDELIRARPTHDTARPIVCRKRSWG